MTCMSEGVWLMADGSWLTAMVYRHERHAISR
jgi:hypothetical protein